MMTAHPLMMTAHPFPISLHISTLHTSHWHCFPSSPFPSHFLPRHPPQSLNLQKNIVVNSVCYQCWAMLCDAVYYKSSAKLKASGLLGCVQCTLLSHALLCSAMLCYYKSITMLPKGILCDIHCLALWSPDSDPGTILKTINVVGKWCVQNAFCHALLCSAMLQ